MQVGVGPQQREIDTQFLQAMQVGGPQHREIGYPISTGNVVGVGRRNKFCENIISIPLPYA